MDKRTLLFVILASAALFVASYFFQSGQKPAAPKKPATAQVEKKSERRRDPNDIWSDQKFYVLQNDYQQLVFSNIGGALAEINLPLQSETNSSSVVKPIEFDTVMKADYPWNARFPAHAYYTADNQYHAEGQLGGFYPLLRRDLIQRDAAHTVRIPPQYYAFNIVSEYPEVSEIVYSVKEFANDQITFVGEQGHRRITKKYWINTDGSTPYTIRASVRVEGDAKGLWLTTGVPEVELMTGSASPILKYRITRKGKRVVEKLSLPKEREALNMTSISPDWVCDSNGYFGVVIDPTSEIASGFKALFVSGSAVPTRLLLIDQQNQVYKAKDYPGYAMQLPFPSNGGEVTFNVYLGPFEESILKQVDTALTDAQTGDSPDFLGCMTFHGWFAFISEPFANLLLIFMKFFYQLTHSWVAAIILLTIVLRILLYPLNAWSIKSMRRMQKIAPKIQAVQERLKKDPKKAQLEIMKIYREQKVNPMSGCIPLLIQMPFLIGMFDLLRSTFDLRGASFIPGWINNLTAPDVLFSWSYPIFFIGTEFHLLPLILGGVMWLQQWLTAAHRNATVLTDQQRQQKFMGNIMVVVFAVMFYHFPSGLNIYWLSSMLLGILQQWWTNRNLDKKNEVVHPEVLKK